MYINTETIKFLLKYVILFGILSNIANFSQSHQVNNLNHGFEPFPNLPNIKQELPKISNLNQFFQTLNPSNCLFPLPISTKQISTHRNTHL